MFDLRAHVHRPALLGADCALTYEQLADRVDAWVERLGPARRLVLLRGGTSVEFIAVLLAALAGEHAVILAPPSRPGRPDEMMQTYNPDVLIDTDAGIVDVRRTASAHELHPDLALLLSTSGSTGSPKLVRLTRQGLHTNAAAIATYLDLTDHDRGLLNLPLHYCYGLSILTSHLYAGAAVVVTDWSVLDACLWDLAARHHVTGLAGVPHTFDQLDRLGFPDLPSLRYVTVAGGKLAAERVTDYVNFGRSRGWDFFVMYGQTEATARMAYLPPELAEVHPSAIGVAIPGGRLRVDNPDASGVGELIYGGPNVMMGYATSPDDLRLGAEISDLPTGDLAREVAPGVFEMAGRRDRFAKIFGLRLDLDEIERLVPGPAICIELNGTLGVISPDPGAAAAVADSCDIPAWAVRGVVADVPLTASGKPDRDAAATLISENAGIRNEPSTGSDLCGLFERALNRHGIKPADSFVTLGADSLSYVELSVRLGEFIDPLPRDWHRRTISDLTALMSVPQEVGAKRGRWISVDPTVILRALAIVLIVGTHANLLTVMGGAHALLAVCGYNAARFVPGGRPPARHVMLGASRIALPSMLWIGALSVFGPYASTTALLLNGALGADHWTTEWQFWFLEAAVWTLVAFAAVLCLPSVRRWDARRPFATAMCLVAATAAARYALIGIHAGPLERYSVPVVAWCVAVGWAAARAETPSQRLLVFASAVGLVAGFFGDIQRELIIAAAVAALLWARPVRLPRFLALTCSTVAAASLSIYLTHWQVYPSLENRMPWAATTLSILVGVLYQRFSTTVGNRFQVVLRRAFDDFLVRVQVDVDGGVQGRSDEHRDRQHVQQEQHRDRSGERAVDGRAAGRKSERPAHEIAA